MYRFLVLVVMLLVPKSWAQEQNTLDVKVLLQKPQGSCGVEILRPLRIRFDARGEVFVDPESDEAGSIQFLGTRQARVWTRRPIILAESSRLPRQIPIRWEPTYTQIREQENIKVYIGGYFRIPPSTPPGLYRATVELMTFCE